jgi:hypothetical protein
MDEIEGSLKRLLDMIQALPIDSRQSLRARVWPKVRPRRAVVIRHTADKVVQATIDVSRVNEKSIAELAAGAEVSKDPKGFGLLFVAAGM